MKMSRPRTHSIFISPSLKLTCFPGLAPLTDKSLSIIKSSGSCDDPPAVSVVLLFVVVDGELVVVVVVVPSTGIESAVSTAADMVAEGCFVCWMGSLFFEVLGWGQLRLFVQVTTCFCFFLCWEDY